MRPAILTTALSALLLMPLTGGPASAETAAAPVTRAQVTTTGLPDGFALPDGFQPEGIAIGPGPVAYLGSRATGSLFRADLRTGKGAVFSQGPGTPSLGIKADGRGRLFVAGGTGGDARVVDARTGEVLRSYKLASAPTFVNDVVLTGGAAWFTDSAGPVLYKLPLGRDGSLPAEAVKVPLSGAIRYAAGTNANGIVPSPDRRSLLVVQSNTGKLFRVDPSTGVTTETDLGGETLLNGDGLLLSGRTLYAVQNRLNQIAVVRLGQDGSSGRVTRRLTDPRFDVPSTVASFGDRLYLPNARFTTPPTPDTPYAVVSVRAGN
ncbi:MULTISPECIES: superoxide dismutase [unclassified Nonomuraea]|uniref:superoxide dismutase n=1 Tax=unclassified Nonomuraea TaxID=2593643 RepID=UPI0033E2758B